MSIYTACSLNQFRHMRGQGRVLEVSCNSFGRAVGRAVACRKRSEETPEKVDLRKYMTHVEDAPCQVDMCRGFT